MSGRSKRSVTSTNGAVHGCPSATSTRGGLRPGAGRNASRASTTACRRCRCARTPPGSRAVAARLHRHRRCRCRCRSGRSPAVAGRRTPASRDAVVDEHGTHPLDEGRRPRARRRPRAAPARGPPWATAACRGLFSRMWMPGPSLDPGSVRRPSAGHVQRVERRPVSHEKPRRVVVGGPEPRHELVHGRGRVTVARPAPGGARRATAWRGRVLRGRDGW